MHTGRTHQIRVHFQHIGHPIVGDSLYDGFHDKIHGQVLQCTQIYLFIQSIRTIFILQLIISNYLNYSINSNSHRGVSMSMNTDEKERVQEELYDQTLLDQYLENDDIDQFRDEFLALHTYEQSEYFEDTTDENQTKDFSIFIT